VVRAALAAGAAASSSGVVPAGAAAQGARVVVVVNSANPLASLPREQVSRMFLKKLTRWPDGAPVQPADLAIDAPVRAQFTDAVLGKSVSTVRAYWNARIFTGRDVPPPEKGSEGEVLAFVSANAGAIGYVSPNAALPPSVRALVVTE
jgi:ABC-type phosphate transport system substrate-binding protein